MTQSIWNRVVAGAIVTLLFAVAARWMRGVSLSGALAGFLLSLILYVCAGPEAFAVLVCVFVLTSMATRFGYGQKQRLGTAETRDGRTGSQVMANLSVAVITALFSAVQKNSIYLVASISALAEAAADTVSSECGQAKDQQPRLITTWSIVPPGTDGAISVFGTVAGMLAALIVSAAALSFGLLSVRWAAVSTGAAIIGMFADSVMGATLERRHRMNNDAVNFVSTLVAAGLVILALSL